MQRSCGKLQRNRNQNPATTFQVWKEDKPSQGSGGKLQRSKLCQRSRSCGKLLGNIETQIETTGLDYHDLNITEYKHVEKVFTNLRHKLNRSENDEMFDLKTNVLIWRPFMSTTMKISNSPWPRTSTTFDRVQEQEPRRDQDVVRYDLEADRGNFIWNSDFIYFEKRFLSLDENDTVS